MLDFPSSPTTGQTYTGPNSAVWQYDGVKWNAGAAALAQNNNVGRNLIHNPLMAVAQRGTSGFIGGYNLDRWTCGLVNDVVSISQVSLSDADRSAIGDEAARFTLQNTFTGNATAGSVSNLAQRIEGLLRLSSKTVCASFWAKAASGTPKIGVSVDQIMGTGGSPSADVLGTGQAVTLSTTWTRYSVIFAIQSMAGKTVGTNGNDCTALTFWYSATSAFASRAGNIGVQSGTIQLWGIQLEIGSVATPLEKPDPQQDLANCQRFYQLGSIINGAYAPSGTAVWASQGPLVTMRAVPTSTILNNTSAGLTGLTITSDTQKTFLGATTSATGGYVFNVGYSLSADL